MSTNYYLRTNDTPDGDEGIHLGKYAQGSAFMFRGYPDQGVVDYNSWAKLAQSGQIVTEYGWECSFNELEELIGDARRAWGRFKRLTPYPDQVDDGRGNRFTLVEFC